MALTRSLVVDAAVALLDEYGLESLSMRRLATSLDVQPGALYWHVKSKQDLLAAVASRIISSVPLEASTRDEPLAAVRTIALSFREALLAHRNGAEIVTLAQALADTPLPVRRAMHTALLEVLEPDPAAWTAQAVTHYVLGATSEQQSRADFTRAGVLPAGDEDEADLPAFVFGLDALIAGASRTELTQLDG
ncbi:hypothetical protein N802_06165 [Knoellia sinensis KCTC 19936]|uniref:HTH tetR-type domain-containing protein n=1 Tax=Knoellia sinensis KCTC 19936 TaxID=1385520 RepID=A0A0A0J013_9MICO|nr:TetR family transcriptional regulator [Knoellia sinensis]KGN30790.1 hypothetical protein N802_06165 [Knoellia sinensis KCTC 19936]